MISNTHLSFLSIFKRLALLLLLCVLSTAQAQVVEGLYEATVEVENQTTGERIKGFKAAFTEVLIKASGDKFIAENIELQKALALPTRYLKQYRYEAKQDNKSNDSGVSTAPINQLANQNTGTDEQGLWLVTEFNPQAVQDLLVNLQLPVWSSNRPDILLWVAVQDRNQSRILRGNPERSIDQSLQDAANRRGLPIVWPLESDIQSNRVTLSDFRAGFVDEIIDASSDYGAQGILIGTLKRAGSVLWVFQWQLHRNGYIDQWQSEALPRDDAVSNGIDQITNIWATEFAVNQSVQGSAWVNLHVQNINRLEAYAASQKYFEKLLLIDTLEVKSVNASAMHYRAKLRGSVDELQRVIQLNGRFRVLLPPPAKVAVTQPAGVSTTENAQASEPLVNDAPANSSVEGQEQGPAQSQDQDQSSQSDPLQSQAAPLPPLQEADLYLEFIR